MRNRWRSATAKHATEFLIKKIVATAGQSYGGPSEKFVGFWEEISEVEPRLLRSCLYVEISRCLVRQPVGFLLAKYSDEQTKYFDVSQALHQGDELKRRLLDAKRTLT